MRIRKSDGWLFATNILALAGKAENDIVVDRKDKQVWPLQDSDHGWISHKQGGLLCGALQLGHLPALLLNKFHGFFPVVFNNNTIMIRERDFWVNGTHILKAAGKTKKL